MKNKILVCNLIMLLACVQMMTAQDQLQRRARQRQTAETEKKDSSAVVNLTERAKIKNDVESKQPEHIVWERIVYRQVNVDSVEINAALYYPVTPQDGRQNLYTLLFKLIADNKIPAYKYEESESFTDDKKINFEDQLKRQQLLYTKQGDRFVVDDRDIPSLEIKSYMIKEGYAFDQATGTFKSTVIAICPIQVQEDYYSGGAEREPQFWVKYDDVRPYFSREKIMTSNYNNTMTYTFDDYFRKNMYVGDILKTVNMLGKTLAQEAGEDPVALKQAQDSIETQLKDFKGELWMYNDSTGVRKAANANAKGTKTTKEKKAEKPQKKSPVKETKTTSDANVRSVRK